MSRKQKIIVSVTAIFIVLLALVGLTYAYFLTQIQGNENNKSISVTTANLSLTYLNDDGGIIGGEKLHPSDTEYTKTFSVKNTGNENAEYGVFLINVINTFELKDDIKYTLRCSTTGDIACNEVTAETTFPNGIKSIITNEIEPGVTHNYTFTFTYKDSGEDQSVDMNKKLEAKIQIFAPDKDGNYYPYEEGTLAYSVINNAKNSENGITMTTYEETEYIYNQRAYSLLPLSSISAYTSSPDIDVYACLDFGGEYCEGVTMQTPTTCSEILNKYVLIDGDYFNRNTHKISKCNEETGTVSTGPYGIKELLHEEDDRGISYVYRGDVQDNYVNFAGMCWRIVRIAGDGSIKLILEDQYTTCDDNEDTDGNDISDYKYTGNWEIGTGNYGYDNSSGKNIMKYLNPVNDADKSMVKAFYDFQTNKLNGYLNKLKSGDWCLGDKAYSRSGSSPNFTYTELNEYNYSSEIYYDGYKRLLNEDNNEYQPTLKCNGTIMYEFSNVNNVSNKVPMYVSTLTADEIVYTGSGSAKGENYSYYLMNVFGSGSSSIGSLTPRYFNSESDIVFVNSDVGEFYSVNVASDDISFRPSVSLASSVTLKTGLDYIQDGTIERPYVIE